VLAEGSVVERGTHAQLLAANGMYADMWRKQSQTDSGEDDLPSEVEDEVAVVKGK
jgi:hypothetical protein